MKARLTSWRRAVPHNSRMRHSIIIPHRNRNLHVEACLWSIQRSAELCGIDDFEVVVVDNGSTVLPSRSVCPHTRLIRDYREMEIFNKPVLLNLGMEAAQGKVLSFLDADAIVGRRWMDGIERLEEPTLTRLCYRVRSLAEHLAIPPQYAEQNFGKWEAFAIRREAYVRPDKLEEDDDAEGEPVFGNSQFSMRRDALGDLRWNEDFVGAGYEDLWFIREIWRRYGSKYRAEILTDAEHAMFHISDTRQHVPNWRSPKIVSRNKKLYYST